MELSVVIPTYNYARFLPEAIDSVLAQTLQPAEIIVADDGSTDDTPSVIARYGDRIRYLRLPHRGIVATRNALLAETHGDWFFNLDADDMIPSDFIEKSIPQINEDNPSIAFAYCGLKSFGRYKREINAPEFSRNLFKAGNFVGMNSFVRTAAAREVGFDRLFDNGWEDYDFFLSLIERGFSGIRLDGVSYLYRTHLESRTVATEDWDASPRLMEKIVAKHDGFFSREEAEAALRKFSADAAVRLKFSKYLWGRDYFPALKLALSHPLPFLKYPFLNFHFPFRIVH